MSAKVLGLVAVGAGIVVYQMTCHQKSLDESVEIANLELSRRLNEARISTVFFAALLKSHVARVLGLMPQTEPATCALENGEEGSMISAMDRILSSPAFGRYEAGLTVLFLAHGIDLNRDFTDLRVAEEVTLQLETLVEDERFVSEFRALNRYHSRSVAIPVPLTMPFANSLTKLKKCMQDPEQRRFLLAALQFYSSPVVFGLVAIVNGISSSKAENPAIREWLGLHAAIQGGGAILNLPAISNGNLMMKFFRECLADDRTIAKDPRIEGKIVAAKWVMVVTFAAAIWSNWLAHDLPESAE